MCQPNRCRCCINTCKQNNRPQSSYNVSWKDCYGNYTRIADLDHGHLVNAIKYKKRHGQYDSMLGYMEAELQWRNR